MNRLATFSTVAALSFLLAGCRDYGTRTVYVREPEEDKSVRIVVEQEPRAQQSREVVRERITREPSREGPTSQVCSEKKESPVVVIVKENNCDTEYRRRPYRNNYHEIERDVEIVHENDYDRYPRERKHYVSDRDDADRDETVYYREAKEIVIDHEPSRSYREEREDPPSYNYRRGYVKEENEDLVDAYVSFRH